VSLAGSLLGFIHVSLLAAAAAMTVSLTDRLLRKLEP